MTWNGADGRPPLVLDLDGTLIGTDTMVVGLGRLLRVAPLRLFAGMLLLLRGRPAFKGWLARWIVPEVARLPYDAEVLAYAHEQHRGGRPLELATGSHARVAAAVARHLGCFTFVVGSRPGRNCTGTAKLAVLTARHGRGGFVYAGNEAKDLKVWAGAGAAVVVGSSRLASRAGAVTPLERHFPRERPAGWPWIPACVAPPHRRHPRP